MIPTTPIPGAVLTIDLSSNNESDTQQIDWPTLAAAVLPVHPQAIVIVKMCQGDWYVNPYRHRQRWGAHAAGFLNVGLYSYVEIISGGGPHAGANLTGAQNAEFLLQTVGTDGGIVAGEFYAGDWEDQSGGTTVDLDAMAIDFGQTLYRADAINPMLYSGDWYAKPHDLERDPALAQYPLWWASYQSTLPTTPEPWASAGKGIACWQFTSTATLPGIPFNVDISWWLAGLPALRAIQWPQPDPLAGLLVGGTPDVQVNDKGEAVDVNKAAQTIAANTMKARQLYTGRGTDLDKALAVIQGDAAAIALVAGLQS